MKMMFALLGFLALAAIAAVTIYVERQADYQHEVLSQGGKARALVLFHPSRDAHFSDDLSTALAEGLTGAGFSVDRESLTRATPPQPEDYALIAVVSNTYWWTPDRPTLQYLQRARFDGRYAIGVIGGAGATGRSQRMLDLALRATGAKVLQTRSFWLMRPNDETRMKGSNRAVALQLARQFGETSGRTVLAAGSLRN
jgi:flavorubredoxin